MTHALLLQAALNSIKTFIESDHSHDITTPAFKNLVREYETLQFEISYLSRPYDPKIHKDTISPAGKERVRHEYRSFDPLYLQAREVVLAAKGGTVALLEEKFQIGSARSFRLLDALIGDVLETRNQDSTWSLCSPSIVLKSG